MSESMKLSEYFEKTQGTKPSKSHPLFLKEQWQCS